MFSKINILPIIAGFLKVLRRSGDEPSNPYHVLVFFLCHVFVVSFMLLKRMFLLTECVYIH